MGNEPIDIYCERLEHGLWAEPLNAVTNVAFILAALIVWPRVASDRHAQALCLALGLIGICSGLFHTFAVGWASAADVLSILLYILIYVFTATPRLFALPWWTGIIAVGLFFPYAAVVTPVLQGILGDLNGSVPYVSVLVLIVLFALAALPLKPRIAGGMIGGALILAVSITARSVDQALCPGWPMGTHFLWHCLNALMLGWMIVVIHRARAPLPG